MAEYYEFKTVSEIPPDVPGLNTALRQLWPEAGALIFDAQHVRVKKSEPWTTDDIAAAQRVLDGFKGSTPQAAAQRAVDAMPAETRALFLTLLDHVNVLRAALPVPLPAVLPDQAIAEMKAKAGTDTEIAK